MKLHWTLVIFSLVSLVGCGEPCTLETCPELCGDGFAEEWEPCDAGRDTAQCNADCTLAECGDGYWNAYAGEECDAGDTDDEGWCDSRCKRQTDPLWCEEVGQYGQCEDDVLQFCQDGNYYDLICYLEYQEGTCGLVNESWGYDCLAPLAHPCLLSTSDASVRFAPCAGTSSGCGVAAGTSGCIENFGECSSGTPPTCGDDNVLYLCSPFDQPARVQCTSYGATCLPEAGACVGVEQGGNCLPGLVYCSDGLDCIQERCAVVN